MAVCQNSNERLFGGAVVLEVADGCADVKPSEQDWKALAAGTSKGFDFAPNATTSDADDGKGYVESIVTNADFTISFEGEVRKRDKLDQYGIGRFIRYFAEELKNRRQPGLWLRMEYGPVTFIGYMVVTALSSDGGTNDIVTFSTEFKVGDAASIEVIETPDLIISVPKGATSVNSGSAISLAVTVSGGTTPYTYAWYQNGKQVTGQTTGTLNIPSATAQHAGVYNVVVTDASPNKITRPSASVVVTVV